MKKLSIAICLSLLALSFPTSISASTIKTEDMIEIQPRADVLVWKFKAINGHVYKRLYNQTRERWETDWIKC